MYRKQPSIYSSTARISLVSSFLASLFLCEIAPIEISDASGMNLMNLQTLKWDDILLHVCGGPTLRSKIGPEPVLGGEVIGNVGTWWVRRWGFSPECIVSPFTGDNPGTMVSLSSPGDVILSLGTSTTLLISLPPSVDSADAPRHTTSSHLLSHPTTLHGHIAMLCYKNGALAREYVRDHYAEGEWSKFDQLVLSTPPGNDGYTGFYFPLHEIIPPNVVGDYFFKGTTPILSFPDKKYHARAILESQLLSIRVRVETILSHHEEAVRGLKRLLITGGGSTNKAIRQMASDVMDLDVYVAESKEGGSIGGAMLGLFAWWKSQGNKGTFEDMKTGWKKDPCGGFKKVASPHHDISRIYGSLIDKYRKCEQTVVKYCLRETENDWHNLKEENE
jgi:xylulokinase